MNARWQTVLGGMILVMLARPAYPQAAVRVGNDFREVVLSRQVELLEDTSKRLTINQVPGSRFQPHRGPSINPGFSNSFYWVRFRLHNPDATPQELLLDVENPHINKLRLYSFGPGQAQRSMLTGDHFPFVQRPVWHPHFLFPILVLPRQTLTCYLWVDKHGEQVQIPLRLWNRAFFSTKAYNLYLFVGFMFGIGGLFCALSLLTMLFFRLRLTFYYFLYTTSIWLFLAAHTGFGFALLWPTATWWASAARPTIVLMIYISSLSFVRVFFRLQQTHRFLYGYTQVLLGVLTTLLLVLWSQHPTLGLFKNYWYNPVGYNGEGLLRFMVAMHFVAVVSLTSIVVISLMVYRKNRQPEGLWVAVGYLMTLLAGSLITLVHTGYLPDNYLTQNVPLVTNALDTIILSLLLANRFKNIYVQNAQISAELAEQRQRNALQLLEGQVIERRRLSQELHDGISLTLANIRLRLSILADKTNGHQPEAQHLVEALGEVGQDVRQFSHALSPVLLERYGLVGALEELIQDMRDSHPTLTVLFEPIVLTGDDFQPFTTQTIYQIALELLNNAAKHAQAQCVTLQLNQSDQTLILDVSDNGLGYVVQEKTSGIGLQNIQARVQLLNGQFTVNRLPQGMQHRIEIPAQTRLFS
ncbi:MAG: histidine kinase [Rudanella sp.]|nr:histidine kinase [Rudanella sp.]